MRLGFDLDGTVADMQTALLREARALFPGISADAVPTSTAGAVGEGPDTASPHDDQAQFSTSTLSSAQRDALWKAVAARENFWETLNEIEPGALARLYQVSQERKWEVIFLTSRPESAGDTAQMQSHRWLSANGFERPSVFVVHGSRGKISSALALDVFVDDRPENCLDIAIDSQARPILIWRGDEDKVPGSARQLGIGAVTSIAQCLDILEDLDRTKRESGGLVNRLKQLLGLKPRTKARPSRPAEPNLAVPTR